MRYSHCYPLFTTRYVNPIHFRLGCYLKSAMPDAVVGGGLHWFTLDIAEVAINHYLTKSFYLILLSIDPDDMYK